MRLMVTAASPASRCSLTWSLNHFAARASSPASNRCDKAHSFAFGSSASHQVRPLPSVYSYGLMLSGDAPGTVTRGSVEVSGIFGAAVRGCSQVRNSPFGERV